MYRNSNGVYYQKIVLKSRIMKSSFCPKCSTHLIISESLENNKMIKCPNCKLSYENPHYYLKKHTTNYLDLTYISKNLGKRNYTILMISIAFVVLIPIFNRNEKPNVDDYNFITKPGCYATYDKETYETFIYNYAKDSLQAEAMLLSGNVIILKNYTEAKKIEKDGFLTKIIANGETNEMWVSDGQLIKK